MPTCKGIVMQLAGSGSPGEWWLGPNRLKSRCEPCMVIGSAATLSCTSAKTANSTAARMVSIATAQLLQKQPLASPAALLCEGLDSIYSSRSRRRWVGEKRLKRTTRATSGHDVQLRRVRLARCMRNVGRLLLTRCRGRWACALAPEHTGLAPNVIHCGVIETGEEAWTVAMRQGKRLCVSKSPPGHASRSDSSPSRWPFPQRSGVFELVGCQRKKKHVASQPFACGHRHLSKISDTAAGMLMW